MKKGTYARARRDHKGTLQCSEPFELCRSGGTGARGGSSARGKDADGVAKAGSGGSRAVGIKLGAKK